MINSTMKRVSILLLGIALVVIGYYYPRDAYRVWISSKNVCTRSCCTNASLPESHDNRNSSYYCRFSGERA